MRVRCPSCKKVHDLDDSAGGKLAKCGCGSRFKTPTVERQRSSPQRIIAKAIKAPPTARQTPQNSQVHGKPMPSTPVQTSPLQTSVVAGGTPNSNTVQCDCGKGLRVPESAYGKKVRCPCGSVLSIKFDGSLSPTTPTASIPVTEEGSNWLEDLPGISNGAQSFSPANSDCYSTPRGLNAAGSIPPVVTRPAPASSTANNYLAQAEAENQNAAARQATAASGGFNGGMGTGLLMMVGAIVWFVTGLSFGYIFFYPPVLLVLGIITFFRSFGG